MTDSVMREKLENKIYSILYDHSCLSDGNIGVRVAHEDEWPIKELADLFSHSLAEARREERTTLEDVVDLVQEMKTDERKVHEFGDYEARTYGEKMLVNAVLDEVISKIMKKLSQIEKEGL